MSEIRDDLRECGDNPLTYGQETHGELHLDALREIERLGRIIAWYWRTAGPYPTPLDETPRAANSHSQPGDAA